MFPHLAQDAWFMEEAFVQARVETGVPRAQESGFPKTLGVGGYIQVIRVQGSEIRVQGLRLPTFRGICLGVPGRRTEALSDVYWVPFLWKLPSSSP